MGPLGATDANFRLSGALHHDKHLILLNGWVAEWFKAPVLKTGAGLFVLSLAVPPSTDFREMPGFSTPSIPPHTSLSLAVRCQFGCQVLAGLSTYRGLARAWIRA